ncbi:hypothetical protein BC941DRAFT_451760 [Chlamydoabsidia padenii]|nr:hypothetical protein BC941DRAFT_451760 [Chlamydoabsidia padenii]
MTPSHFYQDELLNIYHDTYYSTDSSSSSTSSSSSSTCTSPTSFQSHSTTPYILRHKRSTRYHPYLKKHPTNNNNNNSTTSRHSPSILPHPAVSPASSVSSHDDDNDSQALSPFALFGSLPSYNNNNNNNNNCVVDNDDLGAVMEDDDIFDDFADMSSSSNPIQSPPPSPSLFPQQDLATMDDFVLF